MTTSAVPLLALAGVAGAIILPSPSCMINGQPCPVPVGWQVDWSLYNSSGCMPQLAGSVNNISFDPTHHWGLASLDWSVGRGTWLNSDLNKSTCEATSTANCAELKAAGKVVRCGIYHNVELALQWLESNRAVSEYCAMGEVGLAPGGWPERVFAPILAVYDPSKSDWFLQYTDGQGHKNGTIFNQPRAEGDQFFIDWRNPDGEAETRRGRTPTPQH